MTRKYYDNKHGKYYQLIEDNDTYILYRLKPALDVTSRMRAWDYVKRYQQHENDQAYSDLRKYLNCSQIDHIAVREIPEEKMDEVISNYIFHNNLID